MIRVLIVDDHALVRIAVGQLIKSYRSIETAGEASTGSEALNKAKDLQPDVILLDVNLPDTKALNLAPKLQKIAPDTKILALTMYDSETIAAKLFDIGVRGYLLKSSKPREMEDAIRKVHCGQMYVTPQIAERLALSHHNPLDSPFKSLSKQELKVIYCFAEGKTAQQISQELEISDKTVSTYRVRAFKKLKIKRNTELVKLAAEHELLHSPLLESTVEN